MVSTYSQKYERMRSWKEGWDVSISILLATEMQLQMTFVLGYRRIIDGSNINWWGDHINSSFNETLKVNIIHVKEVLIWWHQYDDWTWLQHLFWWWLNALYQMFCHPFERHLSSLAPVCLMPNIGLCRDVQVGGWQLSTELISRTLQ